MRYTTTAGTAAATRKIQPDDRYAIMHEKRLLILQQNDKRLIYSSGWQCLTEEHIPDTAEENGELLPLVYI